MSGATVAVKVDRETAFPFSPLYIGVSGATELSDRDCLIWMEDFQSPLHRGEWCNVVTASHRPVNFASFSPLYIGVSGATLRLVVLEWLFR